MINERQEQALTGKGDCREHYHLEDRVTLDQLQERMKTRSVSTNTQLLASDDFIIATAACTLTLPIARAQKEIEIVQHFTGTLTVVPSAGDTVMNAVALVTTVYGTAMHFKAINGDWVLI